jgi:FeS assembly SUF system regulator
MLRISKLSDYAIIILGHMAKAPDGTYTATDLAVSAGVASPTVSKVLKALARAAVLKSTRGAKGGYQLAQSPEATTIASIIAALEGPIALTECGLEHMHCEQSASCHVRGNWSVLNRAIQTALEAVTLSDMANPMTQAPDGFRIPISRISTQPRRITE